jgi:D-glycero-D-manno-heptose 1,7-bisphosphate phosphatase
MPDASAPSPARRAVFLDRDGTLMEEVHYCRDPEKVRLFPGVPEALMALRSAGFLTIVVTNQSGIARGTILPEQYVAVHQRLCELLGPHALDDTYMCPDHPELLSARRKPAPGMLFEAASRWNIDLSASFMVGDKEIDVECGQNAGCQGILVRTGYGASLASSKAHYVASDLAAATRWILDPTRQNLQKTPEHGPNGALP